MEAIASIVADIPRVWNELTSLKQAVVALKALADFAFGVLAPLLFDKSQLSAKSFVLLPLVGIAYILSDTAMFFALAKSADVTQSWIAVGLLIYSILFFWWAQYTMRSTPGLTGAFSPDEPTFLITTGPWAFVRNPVYSSYLASLLAGFILTSGSNHPDHEHPYLVSHAGGIAFAALVVGFSVFYQAIREEEAKFSSSKLRSKHEAYKKRVWCLLPLTDIVGRR